MLCPITNRQVDEKAARLTACFVVLFVAAALTLGGAAGAALLAALVADFALRGAGAGRWSPLAALARAALRRAGVRPVHTNAGPKMFAARLGTLATGAVLAALLLGAATAAWAVGAALMSLAGLEAAFGFCVGCRIHAALVSLRGAGPAGSEA